MFTGRLSRKNFILGGLLFVMLPIFAIEIVVAVSSIFFVSLTDARMKAQQANDQAQQQSQEIQQQIDQMNQ